MPRGHHKSGGSGVANRPRTAVHCDACDAQLNGKHAYKDVQEELLVPVPATFITCSQQCRDSMRERAEKYRETMIACNVCGHKKDKKKEAAAAAATPEETADNEAHKASPIDGTDQESIEWNPFKATTRTLFGSLTTNPGAVADEIVKRVDAARGKINAEVIRSQADAVTSMVVDYIVRKWKVPAKTVDSSVSTNFAGAMRKALQEAASSPDFFRLTKDATTLKRSPSYSDSTLSKELAYIVRHAMAKRDGDRWIVNNGELALIAHTIVYDVVKRRGGAGFNFMRYFFLPDPESVGTAGGKDDDDEDDASAPPAPAPAKPAAPVSKPAAPAPADDDDASEEAALQTRLAELKAKKENKKASPIAASMADQQESYDFK
jgi:hypothetical protein